MPGRCKSQTRTVSSLPSFPATWRASSCGSTASCCGVPPGLASGGCTGASAQTSGARSPAASEGRRRGVPRRGPHRALSGGYSQQRCARVNCGTARPALKRWTHSGCFLEVPAVLDQRGLGAPSLCTWLTSRTSCTSWPRSSTTWCSCSAGSGSACSPACYLPFMRKPPHSG